MAYVNTGTKRSLTILIVKEVNGVLVTGYPKTYNGQQVFVWTGITYPFLSSNAFQTMSDADYNLRLAAFKLYVVSLEPGLNFTTDVLPGYEPVITDLEDCPPPAVVTTTTTLGVPTTTTPAPTTSNVNINVTWGGAAGATNGLNGTVTICTVPYTTANEYANVMYLNALVPFETPCTVNFDALISRVDNVQISDYRFWRLAGSTEWIEFTDTNEIALDIPAGTPTVNIDVLITNTQPNHIYIEYTENLVQSLPGDCVGQGYYNENMEYVFTVVDSEGVTVNLPIDVLIRITGDTYFSGSGGPTSVEYTLPTGSNTGNGSMMVKDILDGSPGCPCPCQTDVTGIVLEVVTTSHLYNIHLTNIPY